MKTTQNTNCVIYARTATGPVTNRNHSIVSQRNLCKRTAKKLGYKIIGTYEDCGIGGIEIKRPALTQLLNQCKQQKVDYLLVSNIDRLTRNPAGYFKLKSQLLRTNTKIVSCQHLEITNSPLLESIFMSVAQWESTMHSQRTHLGIMRQKERRAR